MGGLITVPADQERTPALEARKPRNRKGDNILSRAMQDRHKRMSRMLGYTLHLDEPEAWGGFSTVCRARLTLFERTGLSAAALGSLPAPHAFDVARASLGAAGGPLPAFLGGMDDARFWASIATSEELKAYFLASFDAMSPKDQAAAFRHIRDIEVAA